MVLEAVQDKAEEGFEDGNVTKEIFQKVQVMELFILVFILAGSAFCFMAVSFSVWLTQISIVWSLKIKVMDAA